MDGLFVWVAAVVTASALLAVGLLVRRTRGLRRRLFLMLLAVGLLPALVVGVVTWQQTTGLGRLAEAPGLRASLDASVELAREVLDARAAELAEWARASVDEPARTLPGAEWGWLETAPDGTTRSDGVAPALAERLRALRGSGRLAGPDLLYHVVDRPDGGTLVAVRRLDAGFVSRLEAVGRGVTGLRQIGLYYEKILRGRALLVAASVLLVSVLLALLLSGALTNRLVRPLDDLVAATRRVTRGERDFALEGRGVDEVSELEQAFNEMTGQLASSEERLRHSERLAAWQGIARRLAHEIKNPLTPIGLAVHRARSRSTDPVVADSLAAIEEETRNLQRLAEEFSALGRMPAPRRRPVDAAAVAREVATLYLPDGMRLDLEGDAVLDADEGQLRQVLSNLFKNAIEATGGSGAIRLGLHRDGIRGRMVVEDDGPGLGPDAARVFEPEFTTRSSGTGLGLAIVRRIVEDHGGAVHGEDRPQGGARFVIEWPLAAEGGSDG